MLFDKGYHFYSNTDSPKVIISKRLLFYFDDKATAVTEIDGAIQNESSIFGLPGYNSAS